MDIAWKETRKNRSRPLRGYRPLLRKEVAMSRQHHEIKCETEYYQAVECGLKKFELRVNDRNYQTFDMVTLIEVVGGTKTGRSLTPVEIKYVLRGGTFGLPDDVCIFNW